MKKLLIIFAAGTLLFACQTKKAESTSTEESTEQTAVVVNDSLAVQGVEVLLTVEGMTCEGCENTIVAGLKNLPGVYDAVASHTDSTAKVMVDTALVKKELLVATIQELGYAAK